MQASHLLAEGSLPEPFYSAWTWAAIIIAFLAGASAVWWLGRRWIRINGAIAIAMSYLGVPAFRLVIEHFGIEAEFLVQSDGAAWVAAIGIIGLLLTEALFQLFEYLPKRGARGLEAALAELHRRLKGKTSSDRQVILDGLIAMSAPQSGANEDEELANALDAIHDPSVINSIRNPGK